MITSKQSKILISHVLIVVLVLSFCNKMEPHKSHDDLRQYILKVKTKMTRTIEALPQFKPLPPFRFNNEHKRNPFTPIKPQNHAITESTASNHKIDQLLKSIPVDALKFVGTLQEKNIIWALIKLPDASIAHVQRGHYLGQNSGYIVSIKNDEVLLKEPIQIAGKWKTRLITLRSRE
jgi:type IV pilus assembly protein PilP